MGAIVDDLNEFIEDAISIPAMGAIDENLFANSHSSISIPAMGAIARIAR